MHILINNFLRKFEFKIKDKIFLEEIIKVLLNDKDPDIRTFKKLSEATQKDETTIRKRFNKIIEQKEKEIKCEFGLSKKPKPKEFINCLVEKIQEQDKDM